MINEQHAICRGGTQIPKPPPLFIDVNTACPSTCHDLNIQHIKTPVQTSFFAMSDEVDHKLSNGGLRERRSAQNGEKQDEVRIGESPLLKEEGCEKTVGKTPDGSSE